ncbi:hypothetical protein ACN47E_003777 [Coniothyrium glycines]
MFYAGFLQSAIYATPPCFSQPLHCQDGQTPDGTFLPNQVHVLLQVPAYILVAVSEILASITGLELAYAKAPENMKSFIMSVFLLTSAGGSALGLLIAPLARDPHLQWLYFGLALTTTCTAILFHRIFSQSGKLSSRAFEQTEQTEQIELVGRSSEEDNYVREDEAIRLLGYSERA